MPGIESVANLSVATQKTTREANPSVSTNAPLTHNFITDSNSAHQKTKPISEFNVSEANIKLQLPVTLPAGQHIIDLFSVDNQYLSHESNNQIAKNVYPDSQINNSYYFKPSYENVLAAQPEIQLDRLYQSITIKLSNLKKRFITENILNKIYSALAIVVTAVATLPIHIIYGVYCCTFKFFTTIKVSYIKKISGNTKVYYSEEVMLNQIRKDLAIILPFIYEKKFKHLDLEDKQGNKIDIANNPEQAEKILNICIGFKKSDITFINRMVITKAFKKSAEILELSEDSKQKINIYLTSEADQKPITNVFKVVTPNR